MKVIEHHQTAVWDRHGYENKMAEDSWSQNNYSGASWSDPSKTWGDNNTSLNYQQPPTQKLETKSTKTQKSKQPVKPTAEPTAKQAPKKDGFGMFIDETQFPSWDD